MPASKPSAPSRFRFGKTEPKALPPPPPAPVIKLVDARTLWKALASGQGPTYSAVRNYVVTLLPPRASSAGILQVRPPTSRQDGGVDLELVFTVPPGATSVASTQFRVDLSVAPDGQVSAKCREPPAPPPPPPEPPERKVETRPPSKPPAKPPAKQTKPPARARRSTALGKPRLPSAPPGGAPRPAPAVPEGPAPSGPPAPASLETAPDAAARPPSEGPSDSGTPGGEGIARTGRSRFVRGILGVVLGLFDLGSGPAG